MLAGMIRNRWLADLAYLSIRPAELLARLALVLLGIDIPAPGALEGIRCQAVTPTPSVRSQETCTTRGGHNA